MYVGKHLARHGFRAVVESSRVLVTRWWLLVVGRVPANMSDFMAMACTAGHNSVRNNTYCRLSPGPFCKGFDVHHCTNTSSVFSGNVQSCAA